MTTTALWLSLLGASYLLGSIPFGLLIARAHGVDIRTRGSGNIGATNVMREISVPAGLTCFAFDFLKGLAPTAGAGALLGALGQTAPSEADAWRWLAVAAAAVMGHMAPIWIGFKGGKGVATGFGALLGMWPIMTAPVAMAFGSWILCLYLTSYVGVSSVVAALSLPLWLVTLEMLTHRRDVSTGARLLEVRPFILASAGLAAMVVWRHRGNLKRSLAGTEPHIRWGRAADKPSDTSAT